MKALLIACALLCASQVMAQSHPLPMRERAAVMDDILDDRLTNLLPTLMRREGIEMWLLISREYNEDPVLKTLLPSTWLSARRRTILAIYTPAEGPSEYYAIARYKVGERFEKAWDKEQQPDQWLALVDLIKAKNPTSIGINRSAQTGLADGITATEHDELLAALGPMQQRIVSAHGLAIGWLETRSAKELALYPDIVAMGHRIIAEAFSNAVVRPGQTTTDDVVWWLREKTRSMKLTNWFHPTVSIQRADADKFDHLQAFSERPGEQVILPGDLLHVDFGITYLRLNTDQQQHAYVLRSGETQVPAYLQQALANANQVQDIFTANFTPGRSGNEVLAMSLAQGREAGLRPHIYTHPIGYHGHAAGTTLGMWDAQEGVPGDGDHPLHINTAYSIELNAATHLPQWGKDIRIMLEENAVFEASGVRYLDGRQTRFHVINSD
ncbi:aminopeptidase P family protein [Aestuariibacter halophilus]|uniref:Aminopeptidase P family protein n=1 Tax=Fluctibacter halophilus TaxID=226011 RepID=A0ABS8GBZ5_9ALTE|nr:M24 family metallopeptidase [Aestuariibacter halophilus]MCC2618092.1 aminopeptidase P family protein [Aestuariibacter halophilus]